MYNVAFAIVLLPLLGAMTSFLAETSRRVAQICTFFTMLTVIAAIWLLGWRLGHPHDTDYENTYIFWSFSPQGGVNHLFNNPSLQHFTPYWGIHVDALALVLMVVVAVTGWIVQWHSLTATRGDADYRRLFWLTSCLLGAVLGIVVSPNLFQILLLSGVVSGVLWVLFTHWWDQPEAAAAARRSFLTAHLGDLALLFATVAVFVKLGPTAEAQPPAGNALVTDPFSFSSLASAAHLTMNGGVPGAGHRTLIVIGVAILIAAGVRLAQVPFHLWLLDTEQTPLPALVLGAVLAPVCGVVLLARTFPLLSLPLHLLTVAAVAGAITAVGAALMALFQRDMARVVLTLAIAQLGLVVVAFGAGGYSNPVQMAATYAMLTTALILAANNFVRTYRTRDITEMGGAWTKMRTTSLVVAAWIVAVAGADLSTYQVLAALLRNHFAGSTGHLRSGLATALVAAVVVAIVLTVAAAVRFWMIVCTGKPLARRGFQTEKITDVPAVLWRSAAMGLVGAAVIVVLGWPAVPVTFSHFVYFGTTRQDLSVVGGAVALALLAGAGGAAAGWVLGRAGRGAFAPPRLAAWLESGAHLQTVVPRLVAWGAVRAGDAFMKADSEITDRVAGGFGEGIALAEGVAANARTRRLPLYIAGAIAVVTLLTLMAGLYATGNFPGAPRP